MQGERNSTEEAEALPNWGGGRCEAEEVACAKRGVDPVQGRDASLSNTDDVTRAGEGGERKKGRETG